MKKLIKALLVIACAGTLCAGALTASACGGGKKGEAYSLTHGTNRFIGCATVTVKGDEVKDCTLSEVCLPTQLKDDDGDLLYTELTYGDVKLTLDGNDYKVGSEALEAYFGKDENCKAYFQAATGNKITGKKPNGTSETVAKATLVKDENGYWSENLNGKLGWKANRDATVAYVKENGVEGINSLVINQEGFWADGNGVSTGATWSDLWYTAGAAPQGYLSYGQLILKAYTNAQK